MSLPLFSYLTLTYKTLTMAEVLYLLDITKDVYSITNKENLTVNLTLTEIDHCTKDTTLVTVNIEKDVPYILPLKVDGKYQVHLVSTEFVGNESDIYIDYYLNLELSMIEDIFSVLCGCDCGCANCEDLSVNQYQALLTTRTKIDVYKHLVAPRYTASFDAVHAKTSCLIEPPLYCEIATEGITGTISYSEKLTKQLIALDYLAMYFTALKGLTEQEDIDYVNTKWQSEAILCCINSLGINIKEIETLINDMATITMDSGAYVNLPPDVVGDNTIATTNRTTVIYTMAHFTTGTTPAYSDPEGDLADAIRVDTLPVDGELQLNGIAVIATQIITKTDIDNSLFTFVPPDQDALDQDTWTFSVRDAGSGQFSS